MSFGFEAEIDVSCFVVVSLRGWLGWVRGGGGSQEGRGREKGETRRVSLSLSTPFPPPEPSISKKLEILLPFITVEIFL